MKGTWLRIVGLLGFVAIMAVGGGWWLMRGQGGGAKSPRANQAQAAVGPQTDIKPSPVPRANVLTLPGTIEPFEAIPVSARISANIAALYVRSGSQVRKGQLLCTLDDTQIRQQIEATRAALLQAQESLRKAQEKRGKQGPSRELRLEKARTALETAQRDLDTFNADAELQLKQTQTARERADKELSEYEQLYESKAVSLEDLKAKRRTAEDARLADDQQKQRIQSSREAKQRALHQAELDHNQAKLDAETEEVSAQDIEALRLQVRNARTELTTRQARLADVRITAPISGTVRIIPRGRSTSMIEGESSQVLGRGVMVYEGDPFIEIAATERACIRIDVDETDIPRLRIGMPTKITGDAFPGRELRGEVATIQSSGRKAGEGVSLFPVTVLITTPLEDVKMGMTADVTVDLTKMRGGSQ